MAKTKPGGDCVPQKWCIVGTAPNHVQAPIDDPSYKILGIGARSPFITRADIWLDVHRLAGYDRQWIKGWRELMKGQTLDCELLMFWPEPISERVARYPVEKIAARFGTDFQTSSFTWAMGYLIDKMRPANADGLAVPVKNGDEIALYGVDMEYGTEYHLQRKGLKHFMDLASQFGIYVRMLTTSGIASRVIPYPFWDDDPHLNKKKLRKAFYEERKARAEAIVKKTEHAIDRASGGIEELRKAAEAGDMDAVRKRLDALAKAVPGMNRIVQKHRAELLKIEGCLEEVEWDLNYLMP